MSKENQQQFSSFVYFGTPVWTAEVPQFLPSMLKMSDQYIKDAKKHLKPTLKQRDKEYKRKLGDFGLSNHSASFATDPNAQDFVQFIGNRSHEFLEWCGFDISQHTLIFNECWVQEFSSKGAGHHDTHVHWNQHVSGFYFLKASDRTSMPVLHDPRPGAMMTKLPQKDKNKITYANEAVHYKVQPGTMVLIPGYTPHQYPVDMGIDPFRFVHWNIQAIPKGVVKNG